MFNLGDGHWHGVRMGSLGNEFGHWHEDTITKCFWISTMEPHFHITHPFNVTPPLHSCAGTKPFKFGIMFQLDTDKRNKDVMWRPVCNSGASRFLSVEIVRHWKISRCTALSLGYFFSLRDLSGMAQIAFDETNIGWQTNRHWIVGVYDSRYMSVRVHEYNQRDSLACKLAAEYKV